ncbi:hypothetical protein [Butyrivibrio sp. YAB3001]|uniref:hypothetical protein n=1 Tax=Butyrivibrio sp. YAB3001 TaxID=1520812 RepID=UPI000B85729F|nr:hypothetical protein [Butyrivibrio sp. YAB3001]
MFKKVVPPNGAEMILCLSAANRERNHRHKTMSFVKGLPVKRRAFCFFLNCDKKHGIVLVRQLKKLDERAKIPTFITAMTRGIIGTC